jgi:tetratricopeptide (TPR) repeat protein
MKRYLLFFIFFPFFSFSQSILQSNDTIKFWDSNDTLVFDDFKLKERPADIDTNYVGLCSAGWHLDYDDNNRIISIRTCMHPYQSYLKTNTDSLTLLHEATHFRIYELYLRYFLDSLLTYDASVFIQDYTMILELSNYFLDKCEIEQKEFDNIVYGGDQNISNKKERELCNEVLYRLSEIEENFEESCEFFLKINTTFNRYQECINSGNSCFSNKEYENAILFWKKAILIIPSSTNNNNLRENIKIAKENIKIQEYYNVVEEGRNAFDNKDYETAIVLWKKALDLIPDHENNQVILKNIDIAKNNQKHN